MSDYLFPLKKKPTPHRFASFDVETYNADNDFYMVGVYHDGKYTAFYDIHEFYKYLKTFLKGYWVVATNLSFDITSAFYDTEYWSEFETISNSGFMLMATNNILDIKFIDTLNYHKASVKQLGEILGSYKLEHPEFLGKRMPKNPVEEYELREYNKQDCVISHDFMVWFQDQVLRLGGELQITIASTSLDVWKRRFNTKILVKEDKVMSKRGIDVNIKDKLFKAYYGGRTEVLKRGYYENLEYYDFNSLYPSVMVEGLPLPNSVQYKKDGCKWSLWNRHGVSKVTIEHITDELPLLPYRYNSRLMFPSGKMTGYWTHIELREALKSGYVLHEIHETIAYSRTFRPFNDYINILYEKRKKAKKNGSSEQLIYKLLMNSLYGKFGERVHNVMHYFDLKELDKKQKEELYNLSQGKTVSISDSGKGYFTYEEECVSNHVFPILPVYITALGRIKLWKSARLVDPVYMDTDSIVTSHKMKTGKELGELDHEHHIDMAIFIKPKMYWFRDGKKDIVKMKGVPKANIDQFKQVVKGEKISYTKFVKLKESIRRRLKVNSVMNVDKMMTLEDIKRSWSGEFSLEQQKSKPVIIDGKIQNTELRETDREVVVF